MTANIHPGLVVSAHGRHCVVESADGQRRICHPRGKKNLVVVGDQVDWAAPRPGQGDTGTIERVHTRRNLFYRQDDIRTKAFAANLDQVLIWLAAEPEYPSRLLARALIAAHAAGIPALVVLNKADLRRSHALGWQRLRIYRDMGYTVLSASLQAQVEHTPANPAPDSAPAQPPHPLPDSPLASHDMPQLLHALHARTTLVLGPSGSGKSTLINTLVPDAQVRTQTISQALQSGRHTTTSTHWYWADRQAGTALIDSPGFQEFGLHHIAAQHISRHMPDLHAYAGQCRFANCTHIHEPGCAVQAALAHPSGSTPGSPPGGAHDQSRIDPERYALYAELHAELSQPRYG